MCDQKFELVSPERLLKTFQMKWDLCFNCQKVGNEALQSPITK